MTDYQRFLFTFFFVYPFVIDKRLILDAFNLEVQGPTTAFNICKVCKRLGFHYDKIFVNTEFVRRNYFKFVHAYYKV